MHTTALACTADTAVRLVALFGYVASIPGPASVFAATRLLRHDRDNRRRYPINFRIQPRQASRRGEDLT
jgi:hypothetical protein